jgi:hypothetical protein
MGAVIFLRFYGGDITIIVPYQTRRTKEECSGLAVRHITLEGEFMKHAIYRHAADPTPPETPAKEPPPIDPPTDPPVQEKDPPPETSPVQDPPPSEEPSPMQDPPRRKARSLAASSSPNTRSEYAGCQRQGKVLLTISSPTSAAWDYAQAALSALFALGESGTPIEFVSYAPYACLKPTRQAATFPVPLLSLAEMGAWPQGTGRRGDVREARKRYDV